MSMSTEGTISQDVKKLIRLVSRDSAVILIPGGFMMQHSLEISKLVHVPDSRASASQIATLNVQFLLVLGIKLQQGKLTVHTLHTSKISKKYNVLYCNCLFRAAGPLHIIITDTLQ